MERQHGYVWLKTNTGSIGDEFFIHETIPGAKTLLQQHNPQRKPSPCGMKIMG